MFQGGGNNNGVNSVVIAEANSSAYTSRAEFILDAVVAFRIPKGRAVGERNL